MAADSLIRPAGNKTMESKQTGVTLIELMIVVVIIGILGAIAYPSYRSQIVRSTRTEAKTALEQRALSLEKCFTRYLAYNNANCPIAADGLTADRNYLIATVRTDTTFDITATPQGGQTVDTECAVFTIDETGRRDINNGTGTAARCW